MVIKLALQLETPKNYLDELVVPLKHTDRKYVYSVLAAFIPNVHESNNLK